MGGGFWAFIQGFNINKAGLVIVGVFVVTWVVALGIWRFGRIEERWDVASAAPSTSVGAAASVGACVSAAASASASAAAAEGQAALDSAR